MVHFPTADFKSLMLRVPGTPLLSSRPRRLSRRAPQSSLALGTNCLFGGTAPAGGAAVFRAGAGLPGKSGGRCGPRAFSFQSLRDRARPLGRRCMRARSLPLLRVALSVSPRLLRRLPLLRRWELYSGAPCLRQANRDRLLRGTRSMLALPDMFDLFMDEFPSLRGRGFPFACILASSFDCFLFRHETSFGLYSNGMYSNLASRSPGRIGTSSAISKA
jgi:hypothetical protein